MKFLLVLKEALNLFKNLLDDLRGKRSLVYLLILALSVTFAAGFKRHFSVLPHLPYSQAKQA